MKRTIGLGLAAALALVGCSGYNENRGKGDAPIGKKDDTPARVVNMPDGFANVAFKCLDGNGIYSTTREATVVVVADDPNCAGGAS